MKTKYILGELAIGFLSAYAAYAFEQPIFYIGTAVSIFLAIAILVD